MPSLTTSCDWGCRLKPFHVKLIGVRRSPWGTNPADAPLESDLQQKGSFQDLHGLLKQADLVVLTCSQTELTKGMVNTAFLEACKPGVQVINVARGEVICCSDFKTILPLKLSPLASQPVAFCHYPFIPEWYDVLPLAQGITKYALLVALMLHPLVQLTLTPCLLTELSALLWCGTALD